MYQHSNNQLNEWMEKLFPKDFQGSINFGYWKGISPPFDIKKRTLAQKKLYYKIFQSVKKKHSKILEIGCGRGHGIFWLNALGHEAYGVDILESQFIIAKKNYPSLSNFYKVAPAEKLPFDNLIFDYIYTLESAQHFSSFEKFCIESHRVLKLQGKLIISTYFICNKQYIDRLVEIIPNNIEGFDKCLTIDEAILMLENSGFEVTNPPIRIGDNVFQAYSKWQKIQLGNVPINSISQKRMKWKDYYTGGGDNEHPWYRAYKNGWIDYYIIEATKRKL